jgi:tyrosine-protein kinase Etk/Wzc
VQLGRVAMNDSSIQSNRSVEDEINLLDLLLFLVRNVRMILLFSLAGFVVAAAAMPFMSEIFSATARVLHPGEFNAGLCIRKLGSPKVTDAIIDRFNLAEAYPQKSRNEIYHFLSRQVSFHEEDKEHILAITVQDKDSERATEMATAYVDEVKRIIAEERLAETFSIRQYLAGRLKSVKGELARVEEKLEAFQKKHKTIHLDDQTLSSIEAIARIRGELAHKEIEVAGREDFQEFEAQVAALEQSPLMKKVPADVALAASGRGEGLGIEYARLLAEFRMKTTLLELLTLQYEAAGIKEVRTRPSSEGGELLGISTSSDAPRKGLIIFLSTFLGCFLGVIAAYIREYAGRMSHEDRQRWEAIKDSLKPSRKHLLKDSKTLRESASATVSPRKSVKS